MGRQKVYKLDNYMEGCSQKPWQELRDESVAERIQPRVKVAPKTENQGQYIQAIEKQIITICTGPAGTGKAQPLDALVLTPGGWKEMGSIQVGDLVVTPSGRSTVVDGVYPQGSKQIYRVVFADGATAECCDEHLWKIWHYDFGWRVLPLSEIRRLLKLNTYKNRLAVPLPQPEFGRSNGDNLPLDPYLLGVLIGDGSLTKQCSFSTADREIAASVEASVQVYGCTCRRVSKYDYSIISVHTGKNEVIERLRSCGLFGKKSYDKRVPREYFTASSDSRIALLQGLFDTDGTVAIGGAVSYSTSSMTLAIDVQELVRSIGGLCRISIKHPTYRDAEGNKKSGAISYVLNVRHSSPRIFFRLSRKLEKLKDKHQYSDCLRRRIVGVEPVGIKPAQCISIADADHLYITNDFVVTHNTWMACGIAAEMLRTGKVKKIVLSRPLQTCDEDLGFLPGDLNEKTTPMMRPVLDAFGDFFQAAELTRLMRAGTIEIVPLALMRGASLRNAFIILDEAQNATEKQIRMLMTRFALNSRVVINGDFKQSDLAVRDGVPLLNVIKKFEARSNFAQQPIQVVKLTKADIVRHPLIRWIEETFDGDYTEGPGLTNFDWRTISCPQCQKPFWYEAYAEEDDRLVRCDNCFAAIELLDADGNLDPVVFEEATDEEVWRTYKTNPCGRR